MDNEQLTFDGIEPEEKTKKSKKVKRETLLTCYKTELQQVRQMSFEDLFNGYDRIYMIVFSYELRFLEKILKNFEYAEMICGAQFMYEKDKKFQEAIIASGTILGVSQKATDDIQDEIKRETLISKMLKESTLKVKVPEQYIDHRKLYILENSQTGATRVITPSANGTKRAWSGCQAETYDYDESEFGYEQYKAAFEEAWKNCIDVPLYVAKKPDKELDKINDNPIIKSVKNVDKMIVVQPAVTEIELAHTKYVAELNELTDYYSQVLKGTSKKGVVEINAKTVEQMKRNDRNLKVNVKIIEKPYPELTFDYGEQMMFLNGGKQNLDYSDDEIRKSVADFFELFDLFKEFINKKDLEKTHYKMVNLLFASPFFAEIRNMAYAKDKQICSELPMYAMANGRSNSGKTFMIESTLKLMTGAKLESRLDKSIDSIKAGQFSQKGVPIFVDEYGVKLSNPSIKAYIKGVPVCETNGRVNQPLVIFASNEAGGCPNDMRKRMLWLEYEGTTPSSINDEKWSGGNLAAKGNALKAKLNTALYSTYVKRMLPFIAEIKEEILFTDEANVVKLLDISSNVLYDIFKEYAEEIPFFITPLTWRDDYNADKTVGENVLESIKEEFKSNPRAFIIEKDFVNICSDNSKKINAWKDGLPPECFKNSTQEVKSNFTEKYQFIRVNKEELSKYTGIKFKSGFSLFKR